jgi:hypothetical protein
MDPWVMVAMAAVAVLGLWPVVQRVRAQAKCACRRRLRRRSGTLGRLQELAGFDNEAVIRSMGSVENARFVAWRRQK